MATFFDNDQQKSIIELWIDEVQAKTMVQNRSRLSLADADNIIKTNLPELYFTTSMTGNVQDGIFHDIVNQHFPTQVYYSYIICIDVTTYNIYANQINYSL